MTIPTSLHDGRLAALVDWACECLDVPELSLVPASTDASFRRYFRLALGEASLIAVDAPPPQEDCRAFVHTAALLTEAGVHVPAILHADLERGYMLLSDFGTRLYIAELNEGNADALLAPVIAALVRFQHGARAEELPPYDAAMLQRELDLFPNWYVGRHLGLELRPEEHAVWQDVCRELIASALAQPTVFVHRDYMPRNLMLTEPGPGIIDFQGALRGPVTYDIVSLLRDAFLSWPEAREAAWLRQYWESARAAGVPVPDDWVEFQRAADWMGMQRHLKVLGIFARINYRDGKPHYLGDTPRFLAYLRRIGGRYPVFAPLLELLDGLEARAGEAPTPTLPREGGGSRTPPQPSPARGEGVDTPTPLTPHDGGESKR